MVVLVTGLDKVGGPELPIGRGDADPPSRP